MPKLQRGSFGIFAMNIQCISTKYTMYLEKIINLVRGTKNEFIE